MYTQKEHFVSRFILDRFSNELNLICFINKSNPSTIKVSNSNAIMYEKNLYEFKNKNGEYFCRNKFEMFFADIEGYISNELNKLKIDEVRKNGIFLDLKYALFLLVALHLVKNPDNKRIIDEIFNFDFMGEENSKIMKNYIYMSLISNKEFALRYLQYNGLLLENKQLNFFGPDYLLKKTLRNIMPFYKLIILITDNEHNFLIGDRPIVKNLFGDDYIFPFSPQMAIYLYNLQDDKNTLIQNINDRAIKNLDSYSIDLINCAIYQAAEKIVVSTMEDSEYLEYISKNSEI